MKRIKWTAAKRRGFFLHFFTICIVTIVLVKIAASAAFVKIPILMYHNFSADPAERGPFTIDRETFRSHLDALSNAGYTSITFDELIRYVDGEAELPEKCVLIVSDDGYSSVLDVALPLLEEYNMKMSVAVIGSYLGRKEEGKLSHFSLAELEEADSHHRLELVSHSYALHEKADLFNGLVESGDADAIDVDEYCARITEDCEKMRTLAPEEFPMLSKVFVYPFGSFSDMTEMLLSDAGYCVTVTTEHGVARVYPGEDLHLLCRIPAEWCANGAALLRAIK